MILNDASTTLCPNLLTLSAQAYIARPIVRLSASPLPHESVEKGPLLRSNTPPGELRGIEIAQKELIRKKSVHLQVEQS